MPNISTSLFDTLGLIDTSNRFDSLSIPNSPIPTELGTPTATSSPVGLQPVKPKTGNKKPVLKGYCTVFQHSVKSLEITGIVLS